ncbi:SH3 domain-containing protein [Zafaria sp. Z1313]|uniref:SH3 domain-containing protein n=1 Tax=unclassified Zafaria TaxID=2828765 RepID=UPI002E78A181|nr:SH3 domain-containing protein [Zafaria sp. J156]MEE1619913.1 SH3 domain-containing protein [Zafaria sp. J156]
MPTPFPPTSGPAARRTVLAAGIATLVAGATGLQAAPAQAAVVPIKLRLATLANVNIRSGASTSHKVLGVAKKGTTLAVTGRASNGWFRLTWKQRTAYVSHTVLTHAKTKEKYTTTRNGLPLSALWFTRSSGVRLYHLPGGAVMVADLYAGTPVWRDAALEKAYGPRAGWAYVRTAGALGWMRTADLRRTQPRATAWKGKTTAAQLRRSANGKLPSSALVAIPWDPQKNLIAGPALADLTRMNAAFKKKFGRDLEVDLTYRTLGMQRYLYTDLGPMIAARPGTSSHGWGLAIDFPETKPYGFGGAYYTWLKKYSKQWGWVHHKRLEQGSPYAEAWHFEYVR